MKMFLLYIVGIITPVISCVNQHQSQEIEPYKYESPIYRQIQIQNTRNDIIKNLIDEYNSGKEDDVTAILDTVNICNPCPKQLADTVYKSYPNPYSEPIIYFDVTDDSIRTIIMIKKLDGRLVDIFLSAELKKGFYNLYPDFSTDPFGQNIPSGVYVVLIRKGSYEETRKMTLLK